MGRTRPGLRLAGAFISRGKPTRRPSRPETLAAPSPSPTAASRRRRPAAYPPEPRVARGSPHLEIRAVFKKIRSSFFFFVGFFRGYFLIAISDPIFVLV